MQVYYFTRSGRSKKIAVQLATNYSTTARCIDDHKNWQGGLNYMKAAFFTISKKTLDIDYQKPVSDEPIAIVFPLWAGGMPPAVKKFVQEVGRENIICLVTSLGSKLTDRDGFIKMIDLVGNDILAPTEL